MVELPAELIYMILDRAYYDAASQPDRATLAACSLVSRPWRGPAQILLFRSVGLKGGRAPALIFIAATDPTSEYGAFLGRQVRTLDVQLDLQEFHQELSGDALAGQQHSAQSIAQGVPPMRHVEEQSSTAQGRAGMHLVKLLQQCPMLYELNLRVTGIHELDEATLAALRQHAARPYTTPLRALSLLRFGVQSPILYQLLDVYPTVRFLRIGMELAAPPPAAPSRLALYELALHRVPAPEITRWLLAGSHASLAVLDLRDLPSAGADGAALAAAGARVRSLRLIRYNARAADLIARCPALEELVLFQLSSFFQLRALPHTLEHLSFRNFAWAASPSLKTVIGAIEGLPRLRAVTCDAGARAHEDFPELEKQCARRGIELRADAPPIWTMDDPVSVRRFPRRKSVSNFSMMT